MNKGKYLPKLSDPVATSKNSMLHYQRWQMNINLKVVKLCHDRFKYKISSLEYYQLITRPIHTQMLTYSTLLLI